MPANLTFPLAFGGSGGSGGAVGGTTVALAGTSLTLSSANTSTYNGNVIATQNSGATAIAINIGAALSAGFTVLQKGAGIVTIGGTATLTAPNGLSTSGLESSLVVIPTGTDTYDVFAAATGDSTNVNATAGATPAVDMSKYNVFDLTLTANCTPSFSGAVTGRAFSATLILRQDGTGGRTLTLPTTKWTSGAAPTYVTTAGAVNVITLVTVDGGSTYLGFVGSLGAA